MSILSDLWMVVDNDSLSEVASFDTFVSQEFKGEADVSKLPVEGSFMSYNKVMKPKEVTVTMAKSGIPYLLESTITALDEYRNSTKLISVITPYGLYDSMSLANLSYTLKREDGGMLVVTLGLQEVRIVTPQYTTGISSAKSRNKGNAGTVNRGKQQVREKSAFKELFA